MAVNRLCLRPTLGLMAHLLATRSNQSETGSSGGHGVGSGHHVAGDEDEDQASDSDDTEASDRYHQRHLSIQFCQSKLMRPASFNRMNRNSISIDYWEQGPDGCGWPVQHGRQLRPCRNDGRPATASGRDEHSAFRIPSPSPAEPAEPPLALSGRGSARKRRRRKPPGIKTKHNKQTKKDQKYSAATLTTTTINHQNQSMDFWWCSGNPLESLGILWNPVELIHVNQLMNQTKE